MEQVGYSLIDQDNNEVMFWGNILGQCQGVPDRVDLPNGNIVYGASVDEMFSETWKLVSRWIVADTTMSFLQTGQTTSYDGTRLIVTYQYRDPTPDELQSYAANARYTKEISGVQMSGVAESNVTVYTDRQSQAMITGIIGLMNMDPSTTIRFKTADGFINANAAVMTSIATAVATHVQTCFALESNIDVDITSNTVTSFSQIDARFSPAP